MQINEIDAEGIANVHNHSREDKVMGALIERAIEGGADVLCPMPNTTAGLTNAQSVKSYIEECKRLAANMQHSMTFLPIMMITERTTEAEIAEAVESGILDGKVYPYMRTTKSELGVGRYGNLLQQIKFAGKHGMKCHFHPEHPRMAFQNRDAEFAFLPLLYIYLEETEAVIISEHGTDSRCIPLWKDMATSKRFYVTLTAHHLATNEDDRFGDVRATCKPPIKTEIDRHGLCELVAEDLRWVMAGADDAPHNFAEGGSKHVHEGKCSCGAYTSPFLIQLYAHALDDLLQMRRGETIFRHFTSNNARALHRLPESSREITLVREPWQIPKTYQIGSWIVEPYGAGEMLRWSVKK